MVDFTKLAAEIWRDYVTDGVPASGAKKPVKADIRLWGLEAEQTLAGLAGMVVAFESRAAVEAANISAVQVVIRTAGYYEAGDAGGALYKRVVGEPSHAGKIQSADGAWWEIAENFPSVKMFGAKGDGSLSALSTVFGSLEDAQDAYPDVTSLTQSIDWAAFQSAIRYAETFESCTVYVPASAAAYRINDTLTVVGNGITIRGESRQSVVTFSNASTDSIVFGDQVTQTGKGGICDLYINHTGKSGGVAIKVIFFAEMLIDNVIVDHPWEACHFERVNTISIRDCNFNDVKATTQAIKFYADADLGHRSDVLTFYNTVIQSLYNGGDGLVLDGPVFALRIFGLAILGTKIGFRVRNTADSTSYPQFGYIYDLEIDGASQQAVLFEVGSDYHFIGCDISNTSGASGQGSSDLAVFQINAAAGNSKTKNIHLTGGRVTNGQREAIVFEGNNCSVVGMDVCEASKAGSGSYPAIRVKAGAVGTLISNCGRIGAREGETGNSSFGVIIDSGATRTKIVGNDFAGNVSGGILNNAAAADLLADSNTGAETLTANRTYYVRTDGNDANSGLANNAGGAFLTAQRAINVIGLLNLNGFAVTVQVGDGTYTGGINRSTPFVNGTVTVQGNSGTPGNVIVSTTSADCVSLSNHSRLTVKDMELRTTTGGNCLACSNFAKLNFTNIRFGTCAGQHIRSNNFAFIQADGNYSIVGNASFHFLASAGAGIDIAGRTVTLSGTPAFSSSFAAVEINSFLLTYSVTYSGSATGTRYTVSINGVIHTNGGGANFLPGNAGGSAATGGQYI